MQHEVRTYLFDIAQAAAEIEEFTRGLAYARYRADAKTQAAVERKFEIIGEALNRIKRLDQGVLAVIPQHERVIGFRNVISHGYDVIDPALWFGMPFRTTCPCSGVWWRVFSSLDSWF